MAADAAALAAAWKVAIWINIRHAVRAVMKAITAAVIAILNVNIGFRPLAHRSPETKIDRGATARSLWWPTVRGIADKRESQPRAVRLAFEPADFGQIAGLKAGSETELRNICTEIAESDRVLAIHFRQKCVCEGVFGMERASA
jgi:hypothetical protein